MALLTEPTLVDTFWGFSPILLYYHLTFWCMFLTKFFAIYHSKYTCVCDQRRSTYHGPHICLIAYLNLWSTMCKVVESTIFFKFAIGDVKVDSSLGYFSYDLCKLSILLIIVTNIWFFYCSREFWPNHKIVEGVPKSSFWCVLPHITLSFRQYIAFKNQNLYLWD